MLPLLERSDHALETVAFCAIGAAAAYAVLVWLLRKRPEYAAVAPAIAAALGVAGLAFLPEDAWRLSSMAAGALAVGLLLATLRWKRPGGKNACSRDMDKMSRWGGDQ